MESENLFENWNWKSETKQKTNKTKRLSIMNEWTSENDERKNQVKIKFMMLEGDLIDHNVFHLFVVCLFGIYWMKKQKIFQFKLIWIIFWHYQIFFWEKKFNNFQFGLKRNSYWISHTHTNTSTIQSRIKNRNWKIWLRKDLKKKFNTQPPPLITLYPNQIFMTNEPKRKNRIDSVCLFVCFVWNIFSKFSPGKNPLQPPKI